MESSELDLSEFQEEDNDGHDGDDGSGGNEDNAPGQGETRLTHLKDAYWAYLNAYWAYLSIYAENAAEAAAENQKGKKLVITDEYFQRVTRALIMRLRQHEDTLTREGWWSSISSPQNGDLFHKEQYPVLFLMIYLWLV